MLWASSKMCGKIIIGGVLFFVLLLWSFRGENGPGGYLVVPLNRNQSKLTWVINTNPKVRKNVVQY